MFDLLNAFGECAHACLIKPAVDAMNPSANRRKGFAHTMSEMLGGFEDGGESRFKPKYEHNA